MPKRAIEEQIAEVGREIGLRKNVYANFVARHKLTQAEADEHIARMEAAYETLKWVRDHRVELAGIAGTK
jgi:hypothetical protein